MKKIILSLAVIAVVAVAGIGATRAYFSATATVSGNTFSAGTINMDVKNGQTPWSNTYKYELKDMKPSQVAYSNFTVVNTGTNPLNVTKKVSVGSIDKTFMNQPKCLALRGAWSGSSCSLNDQIIEPDISTVIQYDLSVQLFKPDNQTPVWNQTLYDMNATIAEINGKVVFLGMIPAGWHMDVVESYHMVDSQTNSDNQYQGDKMTFDITLEGRQLTGIAVLSNKETNIPRPNGWLVLGAKTGTLTYTVKDSMFNFSFTGVAPLAGTQYSLITYPEAFSTPPGSGYPGPVTVIGTVVSDGSGNVNIPTSSLDLGTIKDMKVWLVPSGDLTGNNFNSWHPANYLFDTGLIDYYKS